MSDKGRIKNTNKLYISVSLDNTVARNMFAAIGFKEIKEVNMPF